MRGATAQCVVGPLASLLFLILAGVSSPLCLFEFMFKERKQTQACKIQPCLSRALYVLSLLFYFAISVLSRVPTLGLHLVVVSGLQTKTGLSVYNMFKLPLYVFQDTRRFRACTQIIPHVFS